LAGSGGAPYQQNTEVFTDEVIGIGFALVVATHVRENTVNLVAAHV
jgi:hypothetical protein